jgi:hypothetical protein
VRRDDELAVVDLDLDALMWLEAGELGYGKASRRRNDTANSEMPPLANFAS